MRDTIIKINRIDDILYDSIVRIVEYRGVDSSFPSLGFPQQSVIHFITNTRSRLLRQVSEQVQRIVHTARMAGMGRSHNEFTVLQLQREHEREEDKARVRVQQGLLPGPDSERQRDFSTPK